MNELGFRQVHLDYHTSEAIRNIAEDFSPDQFIEALKLGHVNSVTCFAKCHHGMSYYPTRVGVMHPGLKTDLLGEMVKACRKNDIAVRAYISVGLDEYMSKKHPEWQQIESNGRLAGGGPLEANWNWMCLNSQYADYVAAQTREVLENYDVDGIFFDILMDYPTACTCQRCVEEMLELGMDPQNEEDIYRHNLMVFERFEKRINQIFQEVRPTAGAFFNSRVKLHDQPYISHEEIQNNAHIEIESICSGAAGYKHFPFYVRYFRHFGKDVLGMTARFHKTWADFGGIKNRAALEYECFRMIANGAKCSVGDQLHPNGRMDLNVYRLLGSVYQSVQEKEEWCVNTTPVSEIGVMVSHDIDSDFSVAMMLTELKYQFEVIDSSFDFTPYRLIILPDCVKLSREECEKLSDYIRRGGKVLASHRSALQEDQNTYGLNFEAEYCGDSEYDVQYFSARPEFSQGMVLQENVLYDRGVNLLPNKESVVLADLFDPYFNRTYEHFCSHFQTPFEKKSPYAAAVQGSGTILLSHPIFRMYINNGNQCYKQLIDTCIRQLLPKPIVQAELPSTAEVTVMQQGKRRIVHLLNYVSTPKCKAIDIIEDVYPLYQVKLRVCNETKPEFVYLAPQKQNIPFEYENGYVSFTVPKVMGHQIVVME